MNEILYLTYERQIYNHLFELTTIGINCFDYFRSSIANETGIYFNNIIYFFDPTISIRWKTGFINYFDLHFIN